MTEKQIIEILTTFKEDVKQLKLSKNTQIDFLEEELASCKNKYTSLVNDYELLKKDYDSLNEDASSRNGTTGVDIVVNSDVEKDNLQKALTEKSTELQSVVEEKDKLLSENKMLSKNIDTLSSKVSELLNNSSSSIKTLEKEKISLEQELVSAKTKIQDSEKEVLELKGLIQKSKQVMDDAQKSLIEERATYEKNLKKSESKLDSVVSENQSLRREIEVLKQSIKNLESESNTKKRTIVSKPVDETPDLNTETKAFRFGRTSQSIISKVCSFLDELFYDAQKNSDNETLLNNTVGAKEKLGLTDKEYNVFMTRLCAIKYEDKPLIWSDEDGILKSVFELDFIKSFISKIIV